MSRSGTVLTVGTFDGVHRGHRAILAETAARARRRGVPSLAVTFDQPPRLFFHPASEASLLTTVPEKIRLLRSCGVRRVEVLRFGAALARLSAARFFDQILLGRFRAREIVAGYDFAFGRGREGTLDFLRRRAVASGVPVIVTPPLMAGAKPVSSGRVRDLLRRGDVAGAAAFLGAPYAAEGPVVRGRGAGKALGYPTANVAVPPEKILPPGVFAVAVELPGGRRGTGMANVGVRPTLARPDPRPGLEVHVFDRALRLYGRVLRVSFLEKIRPERTFPSLASLARQLARDERAARARLLNAEFIVK